MFFYFGFSVFMCYIASHYDVMSLSFLCAFATLNKKITYLLYLLVAGPLLLLLLASCTLGHR